MNSFDPPYIYKAALVQFRPLMDMMTGKRPRHTAKLDVKGIGWAQSYDDLVDRMHKAGGDLVECRWDYLVIEKVFEGIWPGIEEDSERWFEYDFEKKVWEKCAKPKEAEGTIHWTC